MNVNLGFIVRFFVRGILHQMLSLGLNEAFFNVDGIKFRIVLDYVPPPLRLQR